ncbi:MAG: hypothetical protein ABW046_04365 [Actinoplanes sp.]
MRQPDDHDPLRGAQNDLLRGAQNAEADLLRGALNAEAGRHQPDRGAMLARITEARTAPARSPLARIVAALMRPAAAATAVAGVLVVGVAGAQVVDYTQNRPDPPAAAPTATTTAPSTAPAPSSTAPSRPHASSSAAVPPPPATTRPHSSAPATSKPPTRATTTPPVSDDFLTATASLDPASFDNWAQSNLVLATTETITALDVTIRIADTGRPTDPGRWTSIPTEMVDITVKPHDGGWSYRFVLKKDQTLAPGRYTFAAQYNHTAGPRDQSDDTYSAKAKAADEDAKVTGAF